MAVSSAAMRIASSAAGQAAAMRSRKASAVPWCAAIWFGSASGCTGTAHSRSTMSWNRTVAFPSYIDCNPRLVEPMSTFIAGLDLMELLVRISCGDTPPAVAESREGVRTHIAMQALLGCAIAKPSRWHLLGSVGDCCSSADPMPEAAKSSLRCDGTG